MEKYKIELFDDELFKSKGVVDSEIPRIFVDALRGIFDNLPPEDKAVVEESGVKITPPMVNPNLNEVSVGVLMKDGNEQTAFKYVISIKTKPYWDDIFQRLRKTPGSAAGE